MKNIGLIILFVSSFILNAQGKISLDENTLRYEGFIYEISGKDYYFTVYSKKDCYDIRFKVKDGIVELLDSNYSFVFYSSSYTYPKLREELHCVYKSSEWLNSFPDIPEESMKKNRYRGNRYKVYRSKTKIEFSAIEYSFFLKEFKNDFGKVSTFKAIKKSVPLSNMVSKNEILYVTCFH